MIVLKMEGSCSHFLENSIATTLIFWHSHTYLCPHAYCCWFRCSMYLLVRVCVVHFSHIHTDVTVGLLINSSMYICVCVAIALFFSCVRYYVASGNNQYHTKTQVSGSWNMGGSWSKKKKRKRKTRKEFEFLKFSLMFYDIFHLYGLTSWHKILKRFYDKSENKKLLSYFLTFKFIFGTLLD